jgi:ribosomal protein RSM22 (predicted rRNA methylase)
LGEAIDACAATVLSTRLAQRSEAISSAYRAFRPTVGAVSSAEDVAAYLLTRLPATAAAIEFVLDELAALAPDFNPDTVLDLGCGPGTASWVAAGTFESISAATLIDRSGPFLDAARRIAGSAAFESKISAGDLRRPPQGAADLVMLAYALTELTDAEHLAAVSTAWSRTSGALVIVEPGRPRDYERLMLARAALIGQGAHLLAPCPHANACPLVAPDWCHFSVRLDRTRAHRQLKQAALGYEDEKFSYLIALRHPVPEAGKAPRILASPAESKFDLTLKTCEPDGSLAYRHVQKRDKDVFRSVRRLRWGDRLESMR